MVAPMEIRGLSQTSAIWLTQSNHVRCVAARACRVSPVYRCIAINVTAKPSITSFTLQLYSKTDDYRSLTLRGVGSVDLKQSLAKRHVLAAGKVHRAIRPLTTASAAAAAAGDAAGQPTPVYSTC